MVGVLYRNAPGSGWSDWDSVEAIHEVDMDVTIMLDNGTAAVVSWAMDGLVEGIDLRIQEKSGTLLRTDETGGPRLPASC